jgi:uncharacterized protein YkwD
MDCASRSADGPGVSGSAHRLSALCGLAVIVATVALGATTLSASAATHSGTTVTASESLETAVLAELNVVRRAHGLIPLRRSGSLAAAAAVHSRAMAQFGFFQHDSRDGTSFSQRVQRFYSPSGHRSWSVGENLLWSTRLTAAHAVQMWMHSPPHRRNILTPQWREIGLSAVKASHAPGVYGGRDVVIITSDFGARS